MKKSLVPNVRNSIGLSRAFNLMFKTYQGVLEDTAAQIYLRPETAQGIFVNFKNIFGFHAGSSSVWGRAVWKSFRNEITPGNFIFRTPRV